jgi:hypothetical protein
LGCGEDLMQHLIEGGLMPHIGAIAAFVATFFLVSIALLESTSEKPGLWLRSRPAFQGFVIFVICLAAAIIAFMIV